MGWYRGIYSFRPKGKSREVKVEKTVRYMFPAENNLHAKIIAYTDQRAVSNLLGLEGLTSNLEFLTNITDDPLSAREMFEKSYFGFVNLNPRVVM